MILSVVDNRKYIRIFDQVTFIYFTFDTFDTYDVLTHFMMKFMQTILWARVRIPGYLFTFAKNYICNSVN